MNALLLIVAGYLAGSIPTGYWLVRLVRHEDIRTRGSGNIGGTNVWRNYGPKLGTPVIVFDVAKGFAPAFLGTQLERPLIGVLAGAAAMLGHWRPLFLRFERGGKMVATCGGAFLGVAPLVALACAVVWVAIFVATRYASLASLLAAVSLPLAADALGEPWAVTAFGVVGAVGVVLLHRTNISRLLHGTEHRFQLRRSRPAT